MDPNDKKDSLGDAVAALTETPFEALIDGHNGLRHPMGRRPLPTDFDGLLSPEGNSGDVVGEDISDPLFSLGEAGRSELL
jgi:hypothetical protein